MPTSQESLRVCDLSLEETYRILREGTESLLKGVDGQEFHRFSHAISEIRSVNGFLETLHLIWDAMSEERLREAIRNSATSIRTAIKNFPIQKLKRIADLPIDSTTQLPSYLTQTFRSLGPHLRMSANAMKAWISIPANESEFMNPDSVLETINKRGVTYGVLPNQIEAIFTERRFDTEVLVAVGKSPTIGRPGRIDFIVSISELSQIPKTLQDGSVSFKDIALFAFVQSGDVIARKTPPKPGQPGFKVTGEVIKPPNPQDVDFPPCENTLLSEDGLEMYAAIDGCISKKNGQIFLKPSLIVPGNVAYESGNIDSKVMVQVARDVLTGFSAKSERDLVIKGTVEGARLEAKGDIVIHGGVQGKDKAEIDASGDVSARFISHAKVSSFGVVMAEKSIMNSQVWSGQNVLVTSKNGEIVGGEIEADGDVISAIIGSDMGVRTVIRLGARLDDLGTMIVENQEKIAEQEESLDKCLEIIQLFKSQIEQAQDPPQDLQDALSKATDMRDAAHLNIERLQAENDGLQMQYDDSSKRSRMVRASKNILPGVVIDIQGVELTIDKPTGPATVIKQEIGRAHV